jgi:hypothetical protein
MTSNPQIIIAPWLPANYFNELVAVYGWDTIDPIEAAIWVDVINRLDALIDKDFYEASSFISSQISITNTIGWSGYFGKADYFDLDLTNGLFDIGIDIGNVAAEAGVYGYNYYDYYRRVAVHELGHTMGLKHPFDEGLGLPFNNAVTTAESVMAYGSAPLVTDFTPFDMAALVAINGVEDDWNAEGEAPVFRFYNNRSGGHFFTVSPEEAETVAITMYDTFSYEGTGFYANNWQAGGTSPVYRFYNNVAGGHFFTINPAERDIVLSQYADTFTFEGIGFFTSPTDTANTEEVYRFYNDRSGGHFFTANEAERDYVIENLSDTFHFEGIAFCA